MLLDPAGPCAWQLAGPLSCPPVASLQTVPIACWFALIIFRPGSDACWRQSMWATKHPRTVRPSRVWTLLVNYLWTEETLEGKIPFVRRNQIYKNQAHSGCQLSDLCLCGLDIWDVWATADLRGHLFPQLHCQWWNSLERGVSCPWSPSSESRTKTWDPGPLSPGPVSSPPHSWQSDVLLWRAWWLKELEPALSYVLSFSIHWVVKYSFSKKLLYWSIADLQSCVNFCCPAKWFCYIYIFFFIFFSVMVYCHIYIYKYIFIEYSSLCLLDLVVYPLYM